MLVYVASATIHTNDAKYGGERIAILAWICSSRYRFLLDAWESRSKMKSCCAVPSSMIWVGAVDMYNAR